MITKQQALEFIYELSKHKSIHIDLAEEGVFGIETWGDCLGGVECNYATVIHFHGGYEGEIKPNALLEEAVTDFIRKYINTDVLNFLEEIPVDIDMLEIGQIYKVHAQEDGVNRYLTTKFLGFDKEDSHILKFQYTDPCTKYDIREIYKVVE